MSVCLMHEDNFFKKIFLKSLQKVEIYSTLNHRIIIHLNKFYREKTLHEVFHK